MILKLYDSNPDRLKIRQIVDCLNDGGVIIFPTDGVYALGCSMMKNRAIEQVARLKNIKPEKARFSILCQDISEAARYTKPIPNQVFRFMRDKLPGPFTFILEASTEVPKIFSTKRREIGIRIPQNNITREIIRTLGHPLVGTSVHDTDEIIEYTTDPEMIYDRYKNDVDIVVDGGIGHNVASTVVDCTSSEPEVIRQGLGEVN